VQASIRWMNHFSKTRKKRRAPYRSIKEGSWERCGKKLTLRGCRGEKLGEGETLVIRRRLEQVRGELRGEQGLAASSGEEMRRKRWLSRRVAEKKKKTRKGLYSCSGTRIMHTQASRKTMRGKWSGHVGKKDHPRLGHSG